MDIGWGEMLLLACLALLIFGPDKLPKAAADAGRTIRKLREMAQSAQSDLQGSAGVDVKGLANDLRSVADLHPKRLFSSVVSDFSAVSELSLDALNPPSTSQTSTNTALTDGITPSPSSAKPALSSGVADSVAGTGKSPSFTPGFDPDAT